MVAQFQPKTIHINGADLAYIEQGAGDTVVLVHGGLGDFRSWMFQIEPFAQRYRVISYSRRYHFPNRGAAQASEYLATQHRDDLAALIEALTIAPAHVVASSYGAFVSLLVGRARPELLRSLVLGEPPAPTLLGPDAIKGMAAQIEPSRQSFERGDAEQAIRSFIDSVAGQGAFDQFPPPVQQAMLENAPEFRLEVNTAPERYFSAFDCDDARMITTPALLVTGEISPQFFHQVTDELERCMPKTERASIPRASHGMHNMNPQAYTETVLAFLAKH
jgi:non-heme chloroperoxidase